MKKARGITHLTKAWSSSKESGGIGRGYLVSTIQETNDSTENLVPLQFNQLKFEINEKHSMLVK